MICDRIPGFAALKKLLDNIGYSWLNADFICLSLRIPGLTAKNKPVPEP
jgi:hypothetical protein